MMDRDTIDLTTREKPIVAERQASRPSFLTLPDEIIQSVLALLDLRSLVHTQLTCRTLLKSDHPLLWRQQCIDQYNYWHSFHKFPQLLKSPAIEQPWRELLISRKKQDITIRRNIEQIISTSVRRLARLQLVALEEDDAKDVLYDMLRCPDEALDVLARRYWINEALGSIERTIALQEWKKLADREPVPLERALGAFDLFICEKPPESLDQISAHLDMLAQEFTAKTPDQESLTTRGRALALVAWLRSHGFRGVPQDQYYKLQNSLISVALCDSSHAAIPIISVAIYCCIAQRLGIDAQPCGFPGHVLTIVTAPANETLDGESSGSTSRDVMYLDSFTDSNEIPMAQLRNQLTELGATPAMMAGLLKATTTEEIVIRAANNIAALPRHDVQTVRSHGFSQVLSEVAPEALALHGLAATEADTLETVLHRPRSLYAAAWAQLLVQSSNSRMQQANFLGDLGERLNNFLHTFEPDYRIDMPLVTRYVMPLFPTPTGEGVVQSGQSLLQEYMRHMVVKDSTPPTPSPRLGVPDADKMKYRVGQIFHHRRFNYLAAITGWDKQCEAGAEWIRQMQVDRLDNGRAQSSTLR